MDHRMYFVGCLEVEIYLAGVGGRYELLHMMNL